VPRPRDRLNPARTDRDLRRILELIIDVRRKWEEAVDVGVYSLRRDGGKGSLDRASLAQSNPTEAAAVNPMQRQVRGAAKRAAQLIQEAGDKLEEASHVLHSGMLRTDPEVLAEYLEKRNAALDRTK
jgi:hypothetical protein